MTSPSEEVLLKELSLLYNHTPDDSRQFTRWQMICAMSHGKRLQREETAAEVRVHYGDRTPHIDEITHNALPSAGVELTIKRRAQIQVEIAEGVRKLGIPAQKVPKEFVDAILHGDESHRSWLKDAAIAFNSNAPLPEPRGTNTNPGQYEEGYALGFSQGLKEQRLRQKRRRRDLFWELFPFLTVAGLAALFLLR